ncbi:MAG: enoyl-CoA hydratase/isomerase family protein [Candidatus Rokubacteria bacterium]|nr:enoyl-CoA hydratase/isomerase family protein [Candidatus Rokubacteria bacterium]
MPTTLSLTHEGGISTITLNRPPLNLITPEVLDELDQAFDALETRDATRVVVLTGSGTKAFCAGADLGDEARHSAEAGRVFRDHGRAIVERIESFPKPVLGAIRGWCIGGGTGLAWACDIRIASESAKFRAGDVYLGMIPTWSLGMVRLVHYIGRNRTLDVLLLGEDITAGAALDLGLVSRVVPDDRFDAEVQRVAARLAGGAPLPFKAIKEGVRAQCWDGMDRAARVEEQWAQTILASHDVHEGIAAFKEKRRPVFRGE